jgi:hypothetical protein
VQFLEWARSGIDISSRRAAATQSATERNVCVRSISEGCTNGAIFWNEREIENQIESCRNQSPADD